MVAPLLIGAAIGAGLGYLGNKDKQAEAARQRKLQAEIMRNSPWTGMKPDLSGTQDPSMITDIGGGALRGASFGMQDFFSGDKGSVQKLGPGEKLVKVGEDGSVSELGSPTPEKTPSTVSAPGGSSLTQPVQPAAVGAPAMPAGGQPPPVAGNTSARSGRLPAPFAGRQYPPGYPAWLKMQQGVTSPGGSGIGFEQTPQQAAYSGVVPYR